MNNMRSWLCGTALALGMTLSVPAHADDAAIMEQLKAMQSQINKLQNQVNSLNGQLVSAKSEAASAQKSAIEAKAALSPSAGKPVKSDNDIKISLTPGPKIETADGETVFKLGGFAQIDAGSFFDDKVNYPSGTNVRRARLNASGTVFKDFNYKLENDFAGNASVLTDVYAEYTGMKPISIMIGQFKEPFGLETLTSDLFTSFVERASTFAFSPDRNIGIAVSSNGKMDGFGNWTISIGAFGAGTGTASTVDEAHDVTGRITYAPIAEKDQVLHFGIAGSYRVPDGALNAMTFSSKPETALSNARLTVNTGALTGIDDTRLLGLEAAGVYGPASLQGEYVLADVNRQPALASPTFNAFYVEGSYFLTGESRNYNAKTARFDRVSPKENFSLAKGGIGAWQIMARYSNLDLNDGTVFGGEMNNITLGLKWLPNPNIMMSLNYIMVDSDSHSVVANDEPRALVLRTQFDF